MMSQENTPRLSSANSERITSLIESLRALKQELTDLENLLSRLYVPAAQDTPGPIRHERK
jgi:hypothetical protein